ncbi:four helix bundle protein, partial [Candidatus Venteria ishoeyi]|uniref:four helix bundle protein n=1 Tax=Candidatus Venteria ishoeyi TaxID=1899563 RepID=UPI0011B0C65A
RGSLYELIDHLIVALDEKYIDENFFKNMKFEIMTIIKMLNGYIKYLSGRKQNG